MTFSSLVSKNIQQSEFTLAQLATAHATLTSEF